MSGRQNVYLQLSIFPLLYVLVVTDLQKTLLIYLINIQYSSDTMLRN